tara:strand:+ start:14226 stop:14966 length:741 start_codon:yes stop_codon:yes gene_type:complete
MSIIKVKTYKIKNNPNNPRLIKDKKFYKLVDSIREFPEMLEKRPIVCCSEDDHFVVLGGNMRLKACDHLNIKEIPVLLADEWDQKQKDDFIIKDNVSLGEWDFDALANEWDLDDLEKFGVNVPTIKHTEMLSGLRYEPLYYEPKKIPNIKLSDCVDLDKYNKKVAALDEYNISKEMKKILKLFAYRFIKIDFESVANYYHFNADDEEKKAIERLRLVLTDDGLNGFIEDDLIKILQYTEEGFNNYD